MIFVLFRPHLWRQHGYLFVEELVAAITVSLKGSHFAFPNCMTGLKKCY